MADGLSPADLDAMTRTMVAEAASQDPMGWAAVGSVIRNRLQAGGYGNSPAEIVHAPNQFEVWSNGSAKNIDPNGPSYQGASRVAQAIAAGMPDVTNGATHFYAPASQRALGRNPPKWAQSQQLASIGGQLFYAPNGAIAQASSDAAPQQQQGQPVAEDPMATLSRYGIKAAGTPAAAPTAAPPSVEVGYAPAASADPLDTLKRYGVKLDAAAAPVPTASAKPMAPAPSAPVGINDTVRAAATGVPILGGLANKGDAAVNALLAPVLNRFFSPQDQLKGNSFGERYANSLAQQEGMDQAFAQQHPIANTAANIGGAVAGTAPAIMAAPAAFGISQAPLLLRAATAAGTSGALGATDSGIRGDNPLTGAALGTAGGAAGPVAGKLIGASANALTRGFSSGVPGMNRSAVNLLTQALGADGPDAVQGAAARLGPSAALPDLGPSMGGLASGLATKPGEAKSALFQMLEQRAAGANQRINADLDATFGAPTDPQSVTNGLTVQRGLQDAANYGAAHAQNVAVDPSAVVAAIDRQLPTATGQARNALQNFRRELVVRDAQPATEMTPAEPAQYATNSEFLHNLRKEADLALSGSAPGLGVQPGALAGSERAISTVRNTLDQALKDQVPGMSQADAASASMARQIEAVQRGTQILGAGKSAQTPEAFAADFARMAPEEQDALRAGVRGEIARLVGTKANDPAALRSALQGEGGWNTAKLSTVFGEGPTQQLVNAVGREGEFGQTMNRVVGNSQTAQRGAAASLLKDSDPAQVDLRAATIPGMIAHYGKKALVDPAVNYLLTPNNGPRDAQLGRAFAMQGPQRDDLINSLVAAAARGSRSTMAGGQADALATALANPLVRAYLQRQQAQPQ